MGRSLCPGLTYNNDTNTYYGRTDNVWTSITLTIRDYGITGETDARFIGGKHLEYTIENLRDDNFAKYALLSGRPIVIEHTATLNASAVIGAWATPTNRPRRCWRACPWSRQCLPCRSLSWRRRGSCSIPAGGFGIVALKNVRQTSLRIVERGGKMSAESTIILCSAMTGAYGLGQTRYYLLCQLAYYKSCTNTNRDEERMAQAQQPRGESRRQPRQQQSELQGQRMRAQRGATSARHARPRQSQRPKAPLFIVLFLMLAILAVGAVLVVTRCQRGDGETQAAQDASQAASTQQGKDTSATSIAKDADEGADDAASNDSNTKKAGAKADSWELTLVNKTHPLPEGWDIELAEVSDGKYVDARIAEQLEQMLQDCRDAGYDDVFVNQAYRTHETQQEIWDTFYNDFLAEGYSEEEAEELTGESVAVPGTSEHELGLAADICSINFDEEYNGPIQTWLRENGPKYGFVQRYPEGKEDITGTKNENWHFRYVGVEAATEMYESGQVLEEYLGEVDTAK